MVLLKAMITKNNKNACGLGFSKLAEFVLDLGSLVWSVEVSANSRSIQYFNTFCGADSLARLNLFLSMAFLFNSEALGSSGSPGLCLE